MLKENLFIRFDLFSQEMKVDEKKEKFPKTFPWWFIFIGYGLSIILVGISVLFIIARGIEFGDVKSQQWLISVLSSFFSSVLLTEPIKVKLFLFHLIE